MGINVVNDEDDNIKEKQNTRLNKILENMGIDEDGIDDDDHNDIKRKKITRNISIDEILYKVVKRECISLGNMSFSSVVTLSLIQFLRSQHNNK